LTQTQQMAQMKKADFWDLGLDPDGPDDEASLPLLKEIQQQLELLECQDLLFLYVIGQRGIEEGARAILNIPGVQEAIDRYKAEGRFQQAATSKSPARNNGWAVPALPKV